MMRRARGFRQVGRRTHFLQKVTQFKICFLDFFAYALQYSDLFGCRGHLLLQSWTFFGSALMPVPNSVICAHVSRRRITASSSRRSARMASREHLSNRELVGR